MFVSISIRVCVFGIHWLTLGEPPNWNKIAKREKKSKCSTEVDWHLESFEESLIDAGSRKNSGT